MKTNVNITNSFLKQTKRLLKKYKSLKNELIKLEVELQETPQMGVSLGNNSFKIRLAVKSKGKGKSGGVRIITHLEVIFIKEEKINELYLLSIYDKSQITTISDKEILTIIKQIDG
ncbi:MAG: hypothetical protein PF445_11880 [Melioribacteraceae bacterium]|jgi:mRNA-degrading endonuclease RelE of RelBE toxin-antitoxin system|nr:hypothetical protein [Melioribacteraceae bacterium]